MNKGLKYAQEALEVDPNDGTSWFYMGNAFMSLFFNVKQSAKTLAQAMDAYNRSVSSWNIKTSFFDTSENWFEFFIPGRRQNFEE